MTTTLFPEIAKFILINGILFYNAFLINLLISKKVRINLKTLFVTSIISFLLINISQLIIGTAGLLSYKNLIIAHTLAAIILTVYHLSKKTPIRWQSIKKIKLTIYSIFAIALIGLLAHLTYFASTILVTEIDAQLYHLPIVINWIQNLSTHIPFNSAFAGPIGYYPANQELFFSWNILPFSSDILINLSNIPIYLLFIILISHVGDILNLNSTKKTIFLILFIASPIVLRQAASVPQGDVFLAFFILSSIYYLLKLSKNLNFKKNSFLLACTIGIGLGIKYTSLIFFLPIMIGFLLISIKKYQQLKIPTTLLNLLIITIGGYFYIRNYIYTQNPFFPGELSILSQTLFKGYKGYTEKILQDSIWHNLTHNYSPALIKELAQNHLNSIGYTIIFVIIGFFSFRYDSNFIPKSVSGLI